MRLSVSVAALSFLFPALLLAGLPVPDAKSQATADKAIKELFHDDYLKKLPADKRSLCQKLLEQADKTTDDSAALYVLLHNALELATEAADFDSVVKAADALGSHFDVNPIALKADAFVRTSAQTTGADTAKSVAQSSLALVDSVVKGERFEFLERIAGPAVSIARKAADAELLAQVQLKIKEARELQADYAKAKSAQTILTAKPEDSAANATVGRYLCFIKGDWDAGLSKLSIGSDQPLKLLADKDLAKPSSANEQAELGDAWYDFALTQRRKLERGNIQARAAHWYELALPAMTGIQKPRIEKRLELIKNPPNETVGKTAPVAQANLSKLERDSLRLELKSLEDQAKAQTDGPKHALILISAADVSIRLGEVDAGFAQLDGIVESDLKNNGDVCGKALIVKGGHLARLNRWKEAEDCFTQVATKHRGSYGDKGCEAANLIAKHYEALKQFDKEVAAKLLVIDCGGSYGDSAAEACMWLSEFYLFKNDKPQALLYLRKIVEKYQGSYGNWKKKAEEKIKSLEAR